MRIRSAIEAEEAAIGAEPSNRERRIEASYRRSLRAALDGRSNVAAPRQRSANPSSRNQRRSAEPPLRPNRRPAARDYLLGFLCAVLALLVNGCAGSRPLKGGQATVTRTQGGLVQKALTQSENPAQATRQEQESVTVRTFVVPAGSRLELTRSGGSAERRQSSGATDSGALPSRRYAEDGMPLSLSLSPLGRGEGGRRPGEGNHEAIPKPIAPPVSSLVLSEPMPITEREETRERTELGAAQKDIAREVGAKLASLKPITLVGGILFVVGLASLVWPPLKAIVASATTSAAMMAGGLCLVALPSVIVGNERVILVAVALAVGGWFLAHRHGELRGRVGKSPVRSAECGMRSGAGSQSAVVSGQ